MKRVLGGEGAQLEGAGSSWLQTVPSRLRAQPSRLGSAGAGSLDQSPRLLVAQALDLVENHLLDDGCLAGKRGLSKDLQQG